MTDFDLDHLTHFRFRELFNQLGWDRAVQQQPYVVDAGGISYELRSVAHKRGVQILQCNPCADGRMPPYAVRQKIERRITREVREHLIVFVDAAETVQIWQWVNRQPGRPAQYRELVMQAGQAPELLRQKLAALKFTLNEEELLTVLGVTTRMDDSQPRERVTKKFYREFEQQRKDFAEFIAGIPRLGRDMAEDQRWYTAVLIDRLMFLWFLQEKDFLDGKRHYLSERLDAHMQARGSTSFYRNFLCPLFFRGFAEPRDDNNRAVLHAEFGDVPYLNGGLFAQHQLEQKYGQTLDVDDAAFEKLFEFFDEWEWHLDERPMRSGREINPDVLGYIFEKFVNQKQMGAYYTKEDITGYIGQNTIIPCLLQKVRAEHPAAFDALAWPLLQESGDAYIYPAMLKGVDECYPEEIAAGLDVDAPDLIERRKPWNRRAGEAVSLPTEIWRETIARHQHTRELRRRIAAGELRDIGDLITCNLDIRQFAQNLIEHCTDVALLRSFWHNLAGRLPRKSNEKFRHGLSVLDPTCGSGAFLFAALNILKPLYDATLRTLQAVRSDALIAGEHSRPEKWQEIDDILCQFASGGDERTQDYAVTKHIIVHNLYGVDIEEQATEIAKLRLFLKLVALLEPGDAIEPLPDIDFNIRHGNTLVGYATAEETERAVRGGAQGGSGNLFGDDPWQQIKLRLVAVEQAYNNFQIQQVQHGGQATAEDKQALTASLAELEETLNRHLASDYGVDPDKPRKYAAWKASHQPFHWYVDFYPLMSAGGFDVVIGNPPYVVFPSDNVPYHWPQSYYGCESTKNLYALVSERSVDLTKKDGAIGLIVQLTSLSSERMLPLRNAMATGAQLVVLPFPRRPESVFEGVEMPTAIWLRRPTSYSSITSSSVRRFYTEERPHALASTRFIEHDGRQRPTQIAKLDAILAKSILQKIKASRTVDTVTAKTGPYKVYYQEACRYWAKSSSFMPRFVRNGEAVAQPHGRMISFTEPAAAALVNCLINSSLFYWYYSTLSDCEHVNDSLVRNFPLPSDWSKCDWMAISSRIDTVLRDSALAKTIRTKQGHVIEYDEINGRHAREAIGVADAAFAEIFHLSDPELDYVVSYDIKYRMGQDADSDD